MAMKRELGQHRGATGPDFVRIRSSYGFLDISFRSTVRVADNADVHDLPPDLGPKRLYETTNYPKLSSSVREEGGVFFSMCGR